MLRRIVVLCAVLVGALSGAAQASAPPAPVVVPPDLQALEQKMLALQFNSERFSASLSVAETPHVGGPIGGFEHIFGRASGAAKAMRTTALLTVAGEASFVPQAANLEATFLGLTFHGRLIGTTMYVEEPFIAKLDGGRPWVEEPDQSLEQAADVGSPGEAQGGPTSGFKSVIDAIARARSVQEVGLATVDGQATRQFRLTIARSSLVGGKKPSRSEARFLRKLFDPLARVELFIAEDGLPVRMRFVLGLRHDAGEMITQTDLLAVNVPVVVQAPPAAETIGAVELKRLLARRTKKRRIVVVRRPGQRPPPQK